MHSNANSQRYLEESYSDNDSAEMHAKLNDKSHTVVSRLKGRQEGEESDAESSEASSSSSVELYPRAMLDDWKRYLKQVSDRMEERKRYDKEKSGDSYELALFYGHDQASGLESTTSMDGCDDP